MATYRCLSCGSIYVDPQNGVHFPHVCPVIEDPARPGRFKRRPDERDENRENWQRSAVSTLASHGELIAAVTKEITGMDRDLRELRKQVGGAFRWLLSLIILLGLLNGAAVALHH